MKIGKNLLIKLHVYAGLFTFLYLLAFGVSSLILNHQWSVENKEVKSTREEKIDFDASLADKELAEQVRDRLGLMGWVPWWEYKRDSISFRFMVINFAKNYQLNVKLPSGKTLIDEIPKGFLHTFHSLHFLNGNIPNAPLLVRSWAIYQYLTLTVMVVSLILGLWLWWKYSYESWHVWLFGGIFLTSLLLMAAL